MSTIEVKSTKDYSMFKLMDGNRAVVPSHVKKLADAIEKRNLMPWQPVMVSPKGYVIDGQHRIEACKQLGYEVYYVVVPDAGLQAVRMINATSKVWTATTFVRSFAETGHEDYKMLLEFMDETGLPLITSACLLAGEMVKTGGGTMQTILRAGTFEVKNLDNAYESARRLRLLEPFSEQGAWKEREFIRALFTLYEKGLDHALLVEQLKKQPDKKLVRQRDVREYAFMILDIYNHNLRKGRVEII